MRSIWLAIRVLIVLIVMVGAVGIGALLLMLASGAIFFGGGGNLSRRLARSPKRARKMSVTYYVTSAGTHAGGPPGFGREGRSNVTCPVTFREGAWGQPARVRPRRGRVSRIT